MNKKTTEFCDVKYMGGHVEFPKPSKCRINFYNDRMELEDPKLIIHYESINNIESMDEKKISAKRVIALGLVFVPLAIVGAMWKKNHIYTIIEFRDDDDDDQKIIVDFDKNLDSAQLVIYKRMLEFRKVRKLFQNSEM